MSDYKPGTVAVATVRGVPDVRVFRCGGPGISGRDQAPFWWSAEYVIDWRSHEDRHVTDVRPLVVLDLADPRRVFADLSAACLATGNSDVSRRLRELRDQIEAQTRPPKPPEPTGLGAVVEDAEGDRWVFSGGPTDGTDEWYSPDLNVRRDWSDLAAVRVLSEGVAG